MLKTSTVVDATLIAAPILTKNIPGQRDLEVYKTKKVNRWHFGITSPKDERQRATLVREANVGVSMHKAHISVDLQLGLAHTVRGAGADVNDVVEGNSLLHRQENEVFADAGYQGADRRPDTPEFLKRHAAMKPGKRKVKDNTTEMGA